jgi:hypothetical protein
MRRKISTALPISRKKPLGGRSKDFPAGENAGNAKQALVFEGRKTNLVAQDFAQAKRSLDLED